MFPKKIEKVKIPPIKIQGIKSKLMPFISENIYWDENGTYWEPFLGSGVVGFNLSPKKAVFSDTNPYIIDFYKSIQDGRINSTVVREYLEKETIELMNTPADKGSYYYKVRNRFNEDHSPLDFLFLQRSNFNGMIRFNSKGGYNVPFCRKPDRFSPSLITKIVNQVKWVEEQIKIHPEWTFLNTDFEDVFPLIQENDFIYMDPPYIGRHDEYYESWSDEKAQRMLDLTYKSKAGYAVSMWLENKYRRNPYIDQWASSEVITTEHFYHVGAKESNRNAVTEALIINPKNTIDKIGKLKTLTGLDQSLI